MLTSEKESNLLYLKPIILGAASGTNLVEWLDYIENIARTELGDIAEAVRKGLVPVFTKPIIPSSPSVPTDQTDLLAMAAYKADLEEFEMYTRPIFLEKVKSQFKLEEKMKEDNKKLYAFLKRSMSPELRDRVELRAADYKAAHDISDGLAYLLLVKKVFIEDSGDVFTQRACHRMEIDRCKQGSKDISVHLTQLRAMFRHLELLGDIPSEAEKIRIAYSSIDRALFQNNLQDHIRAGTVPATFALLCSDLVAYHSNTKSVSAMFGKTTGKTSGPELADLTEGEIKVKRDKVKEKKQQKKPSKPRKRSSPPPPNRGDKPRAPGGPYDKGSKWCDFCDKSGHNTGECFKLKAHKSREKGSREAHAAEDEEDSDSDGVAGSVLISLTSKNTQEIRSKRSLQPLNALSAITEGPRLLRHYIALDSGATISVIKDRALLVDIAPLDPYLVIKGFNGAAVTAKEEGTIPGLGRALFIPEAKRNLLSLKSVRKRARYDADMGRFSVAREGGGPDLLFVMNNKGLFVHSLYLAKPASAIRCPEPTNRFSALSETDLDNATYAATDDEMDGDRSDAPRDRIVATTDKAGSTKKGVDAIVSPISPDEPCDAPVISNKLRKRYEAARRLHRSLDHPSDAALSKALDAGAYMDNPVTSMDLIGATKHFGPCIRCLAGKTVSNPAKLSTAEPPSAPGQRMQADIVFIRCGKNGSKAPVLMMIDEYTDYMFVARLGGGSRGAKNVMTALNRIISRMRSYGHDVKQIFTDHDATFTANTEGLNDLAVQLSQSAPGRHARVLERSVRLIRERMRSTGNSLPYRLPGKLSFHLLSHCISSLNLTPNSKTINSTPRALVVGDKLSALRALSTPFGTIGSFLNPHLVGDTTKDHLDRAELGIVVGRDLSSKGSVTVYFFDRDEFGQRSSFTELPANATVVARLNSIADNDHPNDSDYYMSLWDTLLEEQSQPISPEPNVEHSSPIDPPTVSAQTEELTTSLNPLIQTPAATTGVREPLLPHARDIQADEMTESETTTRTPFERGYSDVNKSNIIPTPGRPKRNVARVNYKPMLNAEYAHIDDELLNQDDNCCYHLSAKQAIKEYGREATESALKAEVQNFLDMDAISPVHSSSLHPNQRILRSHPFFKGKYDAAGKFEQLKSRVVGGGDGQDKSEYGPISSPTIRPQSNMIILNEAAYEKRNVSSIDIKAAYLNAPLKDKTVIIRLTREVSATLISLRPEYREFMQRDGTVLARVNRALYGLIESAMLWYEHLAQSLQTMGYTRMKSDLGVFTRSTKLGKSTIGLHVDDMLCTSTHPSLDEYLRDNLRKIYKQISVKTGPDISYLGMMIKMDATNNSVSVSQPAFIKELLSDLPVSKTYKSPVSSSALKRDPRATPIDASTFRSTLMRVAYLASRTRPDFNFGVSLCQSTLHKPTTDDQAILDRMLGYLEYTKDKELCFTPTSMHLTCYVDASYALHNDARSHYGYTMQLGAYNCPFTNKSGKIKNVCRSSTEAEICALNELSSEALHERDLLLELGHHQGFTIIYEDNEACITRVNGPLINFGRKGKHVRTRHAFVKEQIDNNFLRLFYCPTEHLLADIHTKPLVGGKFYSFRDNLLGSPPARPVPLAVRGVLDLPAPKGAIVTRKMREAPNSRRVEFQDNAST